MIINAKCTFDDVKQISDRCLDKKAEGIEIQIINNLKSFKTEDIKKRLEETGAYITVVHLRLMPNDAVNMIDFLASNEDFNEKIYLGFEFAEKVAKIQGNRVGVVIHGDLSMEHFQTLMQRRLFLDRMNMILGTFPHTNILIENVMLLMENPASKMVEGRGGCLFEPCDMARCLNVYYDTDRFKSVLDICHALSTIRIIDAIYGPKYTLRDFFEQYQSTIGLIHLSNAEDFGYDRGHGMPFTEETKGELENIVYLYRKYDYTCPITLEVYEDDYHDAQNYLETYKQLKKLI